MLTYYLSYCTPYVRENLVGIEGFEPSTLSSQTRCANQAALHSENFIAYTIDKHTQVRGTEGTIPAMAFDQA